MIEMHSPLPEQQTVTELIRVAHKEVAQFLHHQATEDFCAFELFRRAITLRDEQAWSGIYELYSAVVSSWILLLVPKRDGSDLDALVNGAFAKFDRAMNTQKWRNFSCLQLLLGYLKHCARSVVIDHCRAQQARMREKTFEFLDQALVPGDPTNVVVAQCAAQEVWCMIDREVIDAESIPGGPLGKHIMNQADRRAYNRNQHTGVPHAQESMWAYHCT